MYSHLSSRKPADFPCCVFFCLFVRFFAPHLPFYPSHVLHIMHRRVQRYHLWAHGCPWIKWALMKGKRVWKISAISYVVIFARHSAWAQAKCAMRKKNNNKKQRNMRLGVPYVVYYNTAYTLCRAVYTKFCWDKNRNYGGDARFERFRWE